MTVWLNGKDTTIKGLYGAQKYVVGNGPSADFSTLSAALAAITDASANKEYHIYVIGAIAETAQIEAKSHIHVTGIGNASITMTSVTGYGFKLNGLTNTTWRNLRLIRAGASSGMYRHALVLTGNCDSTVRVENCSITNQTTGNSQHSCVYVANGTPYIKDCTAQGAETSGSAAVYNNGSGTFENCWMSAGLTAGAGSTNYGFLNYTGNPTVLNCYAQGGVGTTSCVGVEFYGGSGTYIGCTFVGGSGGANCDGGSMSNSAAPVVINSKFKGGSGGATCYGLHVNWTSPAGRFVNCEFEGGDGAYTACDGVHINTSQCITIFDNCRMKGGDGGATSRGIWIAGASTPTLASCVFSGGAGGVDCDHIWIGSATSATFRNCATELPRINGLQTPITETTTFKLSASKPTQIGALTINVTAAGGAASTISIGTTPTGTEIVNAASLASVTWLHPTLGNGALTLLAANADLYVTINPDGGAPSVQIAWTAYISYATCRAVYTEATEYWRFENCSLVSNCASDAFYIATGAINANKGRVSMCHLEARAAASGSKKAIVAQSSYNPAPIYESVLAGGTSNITSAAAYATDGTNSIV